MGSNIVGELELSYGDGWYEKVRIYRYNKADGRMWYRVEVEGNGFVDDSNGGEFGTEEGADDWVDAYVGKFERRGLAVKRVR